MSFTLDKFLIAFLVFAAFLGGGVLVLQDINHSYEEFGVDMGSDDLNRTYNRLDKMYNLSQDMKDDTYGAELSEDEAWEGSVKGSYSAVRRMKDTFGLVGDIVADLSDVVGIPPFFIILVIVAFMIMVTFALIRLFMRAN